MVITFSDNSRTTRTGDLLLMTQGLEKNTNGSSISQQSARETIMRIMTPCNLMTEPQLLITLIELEEGADVYAT